MLTFSSVDHHRSSCPVAASFNIPLTQAVDADALTGWQVHHLSLESEVVTLFSTAHDPLPWRAHHLNPEVIQLE